MFNEFHAVSGKFQGFSEGFRGVSGISGVFQRLPETFYGVSGPLQSF